MSIGKSSIARAAGAAVPAQKAPSAPAATPKEEPLLMYVAVSQLRPLAVMRSGEACPELVCSVRKHGILVPLLAAHVGAEYLVLLGEHRLAAAKELGLAEVPVCIVDATDEKEALRIMHEVRAARTQEDSLQNEKFYAAASVSAEEIPVFLL